MSNSEGRTANTQQAIMNGIINVNKPAGVTSADVVYRLRRIFRLKKIGHMGTLDPEAQGVLPVGVGQATRLTEYYGTLNKTYRAALVLGVTTDTQDATGRVLTERRAGVMRGDLERTLSCFRGDLWQIPPMYSAVRHQGRRLYELARDGIEVEREARPVRIDVLRLLAWQDGEQPRADLEVICSKGTYIRTLCHDIGAHLGCGGHMAELWRTRVGCWTLEDAWSLEKIALSFENGDWGFLQEMGWGLPLPRVEIAATRRQAFANGLATRKIEVQDSGCEEGGGEVARQEEEVVQVYCQGAFVGIGRWRGECLYPVKVMHVRDDGA
ncbi:MAG: tRNA pseudouridine(55) synthase TruB [Peptococcaceae bacterium]|nr:tRNA pseudouridine(55) synthase TruB [Peptococcaceae bacterium]